MKKYVKPEVEIIEFGDVDIFMSPGPEANPASDDSPKGDGPLKVEDEQLPKVDTFEILSDDNQMAGEGETNVSVNKDGTSNGSIGENNADNNGDGENIMPSGDAPSDTALPESISKIPADDTETPAEEHFDIPVQEHHEIHTEDVLVMDTTEGEIAPTAETVE